MKPKTPVSLARRVWPALAVAGASAAFVSALDKPTQFVADTVSLTGSEDASAPATLLTIPAIEPAPGAAVPQVASTIPPIPVAVPTPTAVPVQAAPACGQPIDGPVVNTRWGPVQVQASLAPDHSVCNVTTLQTPDSHNRSIQINNYAAPILNKRVLAAGSAQINGVSGATITSRGYAASLQYILDNS